MHGNDVLLGRFLRVTGAIRSMMAASSNLDAVISLFRTTLNSRKINISVARILTYGARSDDKNARQNSMWILANVIDNTTVCVPLDHLYDPAISPSGRANLLAIVSVVAPWAYKENYNNIKTVVAFTQHKLSDSTSDLLDTSSILNNIEQRLQTQNDNTNKIEAIPSNLQTCKHYPLQYAKSQQLSY